MGLNEIRKQVNKKIDIDELISEMRDRMRRWHGKAGLKAILREELEQLLKSKYPQELSDLEKYLKEVNNAMYGLGPLEGLLADPEVTDITVIGTRVMYKKNGVKIDADERFADDMAVRTVQDKILAPLNKAVTIAQPSQDAELPDGSRAFIAIPPQSERPVVIIRKHNMLNVPLECLANNVEGLGELVDYFKIAVKERKNIIVAGETGAGKTTFINAMGFEIQEKHTVAVLEDTREIKLNLPYVLYFRIRAGAGEAKTISYSDILRDCLRADPDRIILTEIRTPISAYEFIHVLNSGHKGSMTTLHANSCADALLRIEMLIQEHKYLESRIIRRLISRVADVIVFLKLKQDEKGNTVGRMVGEVVEIQGMLPNGEFDIREILKC